MLCFHFLGEVGEAKQSDNVPQELTSDVAKRALKLANEKLCQSTCHRSE